MNFPASPPQAELPPRDDVRPNSEPASRRILRHSPLVPIGGWWWLRDKQRKDDGRPATRTARSSSARLNVSRARRLCQGGRAVSFWVLGWYAVSLLIPMLLVHRWQRIAPAHEAKKLPALRELVSNHPERPLVLLLGSSRGCYAFRASSLDGMPDSDGRPLSVYNFGIPATGPITYLFYLRDMLAEGIRPRFLLLEFLPPLMCQPQRRALTEEGMAAFEGISAHRFLQWFPYLHRPEKRATLWLEGHFAPWYTFHRQIQLEVNCLIAGKPFPTYEPIDKWGWHLAIPMPLPAAERAFRLATACGGYAPGLGNFHLGKQPTKALRETLDLCRREKIPTALVWMPESSEFRGWYSDEAKVVLHDLLDELHQTYGVPVIDAQTWLADEDFEDGHHTVLQGADAFTRRLHAELVGMLAQSESANVPPSRAAPPSRAHSGAE